MNVQEGNLANPCFGPKHPVDFFCEGFWDTVFSGTLRHVGSKPPMHSVSRAPSTQCIRASNKAWWRSTSRFRSSCTIPLEK